MREEEKLIRFARFSRKDAKVTLSGNTVNCSMFLGKEFNLISSVFFKINLKWFDVFWKESETQSYVFKKVGKRNGMETFGFKHKTNMSVLNLLHH